MTSASLGVTIGNISGASRLTEARFSDALPGLQDGATAFLRAAQSSDVVVMRLLLAHGADPKIATEDKVTPLAVATGVDWTEGVTYEW